MTKNDFLDKLRFALSGKVSASLVHENMTYYSDYIDSQISMGRSEQEVMDMLGDPRLIARTIIQTNGTETVEDFAYRENGSYDGMDSDRGNEIKVRTVPSWLSTVIVIVIVVCVISFIFSVVSFLLPIVLPVLIVVFFVKLFRDWLN